VPESAGPTLPIRTELVHTLPHSELIEIGYSSSYPLFDGIR
jgi:hypothetical protein